MERPLKREPPHGYSSETVTQRIEVDPYNRAWTTQFKLRLENPSIDPGPALIEFVLEDSADKPLPIELVLDVLPELDPVRARQLISAARRLAIWNESEESWLLFHQACAEARVGAANWLEHAVPLVQRIWDTSATGSALRGWAACWLVERGILSTKYILSAFTEASAARTSHGHYLRRLRLWSQRPSEVQPILATAATALADAWSVLGLERLPDRRATAGLLALAVLRDSPHAASRLKTEVECIAAETSHQETERDFQALLARLEEGSPLPRYARNSIDWDDPIATLLREGHAKDAARVAKQLPEPAEHDLRLRRVVLAAEASRRAHSSGQALEILDNGSHLLVEARAETSWAFHCLRAVIHWARVEYGLALLSTDAARNCAGLLGDHTLLYRTTLLRQRLFHNIRLAELKREADSVMDALDMVFAGLGLQPPDRQVMSISQWLAVDVPTFHGAIESARSLLDSWRVNTQSGVRPLGTVARQLFGQRLHGLLGQWESLGEKWTQEPLSLMHFSFHMADLAVSARREWTENDEIYTAHLNTWLGITCREAVSLEAFKQVGVITTMLTRHSAVIREYESPKLFASMESANRLALDQIARFLAASKSPIQRRWLLRAANHRYAEVLDGFLRRASADSENLGLLEVLQDLKQPSMEDDSEEQELALARPSEVEESVLFEDDDLTQKEWVRLTGERLTAEDAVVLDLFLTNTHLFCFLVEAVDSKLVCHAKALDIPWHSRLRQRFSQWRANMRTSFDSLSEEGVDASDVHIASEKLERQLARNPEVLPGSLQAILGNRRPRIIYVAPSMSLHGMPIHALRDPSGWSLSSLAPVLRIAKTRQLAASSGRKQGPVCILAGPESEFKNAAQQLATECGVEVSEPRSWGDLKRSLQSSRLVVILGHGWFDKTSPSRSRVALDNGLRLTLRKIQDLGVDGAEVVMLSCWSGWSLRSGQPIGEVIGGPSSWMLAGAGALLAPLWPIPIAAGQRYLGDYIKARLRDKTRAEALRVAQQQSSQYEFGSLCSSAYVLWGTEDR